jgi:diacylglycerol O-acyltransferase
MSSYAMPAADVAWLHMDRPTNPMVVSALVSLAEAPEPEAVAEVLERRLVAVYPRFRQRVAEQRGRVPAFEDDPSFDLDNHLQRLTLSPPGDRAALQALVGDLIASPLAKSRPLWHAYLIEGYEGGAAMLWRIHHCIADGIALSRVLLSLADEAAGETGSTAAEGETEAAAVEPHPPRSPVRRLADIPARAVSAARKLGGAAVHEGMETLAHPDHLRELASTALRDASTGAKLLAAPTDPPSELRGPLSGARRVAWSQPFPLSRIKDVGRRQRVTVNDVLVTALAGALHRQLGASGAAPEEIHTMVPFNLRPPDQAVAPDLGNEFALILLALPVGDVAPAERLREVSSRMGAVKRSHEAPIAFGILGAMGLTPPWVEDRLIGFFTEKASLVVTNVPGPREPLHFAGAPIDAVLVWAPCSGSLGMTVSIFSYDGEVTAGFMTDTALIAEPGQLVRAFEEELHQLMPEPSRTGSPSG